MKKRNIIYNLISIAFILFAVLYYFCEVKPNKAFDYYAHAESLDLVEIINSPNLTLEELESRNGNLIIERVVGEVTNAETGEGYIIGWPEYYISYAEVADISNGNIICTYFIYNPDSNYADDVLLRFDYVIDGSAVK